MHTRLLWLLVPLVLGLLLVPGLYQRLTAGEAAAGETGPPVVGVVVLVPGPREHRRSFPGALVAPRQARLGFESGGTVADLPIAEGREVPAETVLARLRMSAFEAGRTAARSRLAQAERAEREAERLREQSAESRSRWRDTVEARRQAEAEAQRAQAAYDGAEVRAPWAGVLVRRACETGDVVAAGGGGFEFLSLDPLEFRFPVSENLLPELPAVAPAAPGGPAGPPELLSLRAFPGGAPFPGTLFYRPDAPDPRDGGFHCRVAVPNEARRLRPGMVGVATLTLARVARAVALPWDAVERDGARLFAWLAERADGTPAPSDAAAGVESTATLRRVALTGVRRFGTDYVSEQPELFDRLLVVRRPEELAEGRAVRARVIETPAE